MRVCAFMMHVHVDEWWNMGLEFLATTRLDVSAVQRPPTGEIEARKMADSPDPNSQ